MANDKKATVVILTYNGEVYLAEIIESILRQKVDFDFELLIVDSGSKDKTLSIVKSFQNKDDRVRLHEIPNTEFGHGKTRNLAAQLANGELVVYLTHDATPAHDRWLYEILKPFDLQSDIVGVMGKQIARPHCIPMLKYEIASVFGNFGPDFGTGIFYKDDFIQDQGVYDAVRFYSDANSAARKQTLLGEIPYREVNYAEDQLFGEDIIEHGKLKAYAPRGAVIHSNDLRLSEYAKRMFDETYGLRKTGYKMDRPSRHLVAKMIIKGSVKDSVRILRDRQYSSQRKIYWLVVNPLFHIQKWRGVRQALVASLDDESSKHSLESSRR
jgi:rhamnosyltransferase